MSKLKTKKWTLLYKEISKLGEGGNADVYIVEDMATRANRRETRYLPICCLI